MTVHTNETPGGNQSSEKPLCPVAQRLSWASQSHSIPTFRDGPVITRNAPRPLALFLCGSSSDESAGFEVLTKDEAHTIDIG